jgi:hypothetical protein
MVNTPPSSSPFESTRNCSLRTSEMLMTAVARMISTMEVLRAHTFIVAICFVCSSSICFWSASRLARSEVLRSLGALVLYGSISR